MVYHYTNPSDVELGNIDAYVKSDGTDRLWCKEVLMSNVHGMHPLKVHKVERYVFIPLRLRSKALFLGFFCFTARKIWSKNRRL